MSSHSAPKACLLSPPLLLTPPPQLIASFDAPSDPFLGRLFAMAAATIAMNTADSYTDCRWAIGALQELL